MGKSRKAAAARRKRLQRDYECASKDQVLVSSYFRYEPVRTQVHAYCRARPFMKEIVVKELGKLHPNPHKPLPKQGLSAHEISSEVKKQKREQKGDEKDTKIKVDATNEEAVLIKNVMQGMKNNDRWLLYQPVMPSIINSFIGADDLLNKSRDFINHFSSTLLPNGEDSRRNVIMLYNTADIYEQIMLYNIAFVMKMINGNINHAFVFDDENGMFQDVRVSLISLHLLGIGIYQIQYPKCAVEALDEAKEALFVERKSYVSGYVPSVFANYSELTQALLSSELVYVVLYEKDAKGAYHIRTNIPHQFEFLKVVKGDKMFHESTEKAEDEYKQQEYLAFDGLPNVLNIVQPLQLTYFTIFARDYCSTPSAEDVLLFYAMQTFKNVLFELHFEMMGIVNEERANCNAEINDTRDTLQRAIKAEKDALETAQIRILELEKALRDCQSGTKAAATEAKTVSKTPSDLLKAIENKKYELQTVKEEQEAKPTNALLESIRRNKSILKHVEIDEKRELNLTPPLLRQIKAFKPKQLKQITPPKTKKPTKSSEYNLKTEDLPEKYKLLQKALREEEEDSDWDE